MSVSVSVTTAMASKAALAFADGFEDGDALGADGEAVGGVFDIATAENSAGSGAERGANAKIGVRRVGVLARLPGGFDESHGCHASPPDNRARFRRKDLSVEENHSSNEKLS